MGKFPRKVEGYRINTNNIDEEELFDEEQDARESIEVEKCVMWECVDCLERYEDRDEAYGCCG